MEQKLRMLLLVFVALAVAIPVTASAVTFNPQIGVNSSILTSDPQNGEHQTRAGWQVGGYVRFDSKKFYFQPGLFYHLMGTELQTKNQITHEEFTFQNQVHSIQVPLLIGYNVVDGSTFDLRLQAGTCTDFITGVDHNDHFTKDDLNGNFWSFKFAVGVDFSILSLDLGYDLGMDNFYADERQDDGKMNSFFLNAGVRF